MVVVLTVMGMFLSVIALGGLFSYLTRAHYRRTLAKIDELEKAAHELSSKGGFTIEVIKNIDLARGELPKAKFYYETDGVVKLDRLLDFIDHCLSEGSDALKFAEFQLSKREPQKPESEQKPPQPE